MHLRRASLALCACLFSSSVLAQPQAAAHRAFRIGLLSDSNYFSEHATAAQWDAGEQLAGLRQGMNDLGVVEGKDWILIPRIANGDHALLEKYAAELVAMKVDAIASSSTTAALAARHATKTTPIVTWSSQLGEVVPAGLDSNVTGFKAPDEISECVKTLQVLVPNLKRLAVLYDTSYVNVPLMVQKASNRAAEAGLEPILIEVQDNEPLGPAFDRMVTKNVQALLVLNHPRFHRHPEEAATLALHYRIPMASPYKETAEVGGLIAHHPDWEKIWRRAAKMIQQVLDGTPPGQIPVQTGEMRYYINVRTAQALGLKIPDSLRAQAELIGAEANSLEQEIKRLEEERLQAVLNNDTATLKRLYADGMTVIDIGGEFHANTSNSSATLNQPATRQTLKWIMEEITVKPVGAAAAIALMKARVQDVIDGQHRDFTGRLTDVWIKGNGQWQIVARHGTEISAAPSQPKQAKLSTEAAPETEMRPPEALTPEQQEVFNFHRRLHDAHWRADVATLQQLLTADWFVANSAGQIISRDEFLNSLKPGNPPRLQEEIRIRTFGDVAVMTLRTTWPDGRMQRGTEVFIKENGAWKQAANQQTLVKENAPQSNTESNASAVATPSRLSTSGSEKEVLTLEEQMESLQRANSPERTALWADDLLYIGNDGAVHDQRSLARAISAGEVKTDSLDVTERNIRVYSEVAIVTAKEQMRASFHGKPPENFVQRYTRVWAQSGRKWQVVSFQATKLTDAPVQTAGFEACSAPDAPVNPGSIEETILRLQDEHSETTRNNESARGNGWLGDDYIGINGNGLLYDKPAVIQLYRPGSLKYRVEKYGGRRVRVYGDTAILTGAWCVRQLREGQKETTFANRITRVWVNRNGKWEVVSWQGTPIPPSHEPNDAQQKPARANADPEAEKELRAIFDAIAAAILHHDPKVIEKYYSPDYLMTFSDGRRGDFENSLHVLTDESRNEWRVHDRSNERFLFYGDTALAIFTVHSQWIARASHKQFDVREHVTQTWIRRDRRWTLVATHVSSIDSKQQ